MGALLGLGGQALSLLLRALGSKWVWAAIGLLLLVSYHRGEVRSAREDGLATARSECAGAAQSAEVAELRRTAEADRAAASRETARAQAAERLSADRGRQLDEVRRLARQSQPEPGVCLTEEVTDAIRAVR